MITFTITTCKRIECFMKTMDSFLQHCKDIHKVTRFLIVDDSSTTDDRLAMKRRFPYMDMICHDGRNHAKSLNLIRSNIFTDYVIMFEDDWECTEDFMISELVNSMGDYLRLSTPFMFGHTGRMINDKPIMSAHFELEKLDNYCPPIYTDWINESNHRELLTALPHEDDSQTSHWPGFSLNPSIVKTSLLKSIPFDEAEKPSFMELSYGIQHVLAGTVIEGVDLNINHIGDDMSAYQLNGELRWWDESSQLPTIVSVFLDLDRADRSQDHYIDSLKRIMKLPNPKVLFIDDRYEGTFISSVLNQIRYVKPSILTDTFGDKMKKMISIVSDPEWVGQSEWIADSVLTNEKYIPLTFLKHHLLDKVATENPFNTTEFYWVDSGIYASFSGIQHISIVNQNSESLLMTSFPYWTNAEIHGLNIDYINSNITHENTHVVLRASLFGGGRMIIRETLDLMTDCIDKCLHDNVIGTEEAIYTLMYHNTPHVFKIHKMNSGDIAEYFNSII